MKLTLCLCVAVLAASAAQAQILRPEAVNGAMLGGVAGAVVGHNSGDLRHNAWKGAAIGAGAGLVAGEMIGNQRAAGRGGQVAVAAHRGGGDYIYRSGPAVHTDVGFRHGGYGYSGYRHGGYGHGDRTWGHVSFGYPRTRGYYYSGYYGYPGYGVGYYPDYAYDYSYAYPSYGYGSYAANGLFWGGLAGAIIGHNSGDFRHNAWRGAAWGAGAGWLLGTIADANRRSVTYQAPVVQAAPAATVPAAPAQAPQQVTIINNYYNAPAAPMAAANGLFGRN